jgi:3-demethoxyubiquinol 3-hydroxylase
MHESIAESRNFSNFDRWLSNVDRGLKAMMRLADSDRPSPAQEIPDLILDESDRKKSAALMRINHIGEVCAQALYQGQSLTTRNQETHSMLLKAATEEIDHLIWCQKRLYELNSRSSYLIFFWYSGSFLIGTMVGLFPNSINLGFIAETERQVSAHLDEHLEKMAIKDLRSRAILSQMRKDEQEHGDRALQEGGETLPTPVQRLMTAASKVMTITAFWI